MAGRPPPGQNIGALGGGQGNPNGGDASAAGARPTELLRAWHSFNMAAARTLPTSLVRAGQVKHAGLSVLRSRGRFGH